MSIAEKKWQPGDVAIVEMSHGPTVAIWTGQFWAWSHGNGPYDGVSHCYGGSLARPLVAIDPEDEARVDALIDILWGDRDPSNRPATWRIQERLREFANPTPPIEEPTGLGAVVEDTDGLRWVLNNPRGSGSWSQENAAANLGVHEYRSWQQINVVRVLSEGVPTEAVR